MSLADALSPISEADVRRTYLAAPTLQIDDAKTDISFQVSTKTADGTRVDYLVGFRTSTGEPILETALQRWLCNNKRLLGQPGRSRVAYRVRFHVRSNFQGKGFAYYILMREEDLFRRWGAKEIQVTAMDDGRWVWTRRQFGYSMPVADFQLLQQRYIEWQRETSAAAIVRAKTMFDFPRAFLLSAATGFALFKSL
jgi:GNAT superfamily N-acetyltransferase